MRWGHGSMVALGHAAQMEFLMRAFEDMYPTLLLYEHY